MHYRVAELNEKEFQAVKKVEAIMEEETGKIVIKKLSKKLLNFLFNKKWYNKKDII